MPNTTTIAEDSVAQLQAAVTQAAKKVRPMSLLDAAESKRKKKKVKNTARSSTLKNFLSALNNKK